MRYKYEGRGASGKVKGVIEADNEREVQQLLKSRRIFPINIKVEEEAKTEIKLNFERKIKTKDLALFCRQFHTMLNAGVTIISAIEILKDQTKNKRMYTGLDLTYDEIQKGSTLSEAMIKSEIFPNLLTSMVEAGEISGSLDQIMNRMANHYEKENKINNKIKSAMTYPIILGVLTVLVVIGLLVFVLPRFVSLFSSAGEDLPPLTRMVVGTSNFLTNHYILMTLIIAAIVFGIYSFAKSKKGKYFIDKTVLKIPFVRSNIVKIITSRFSRTLATLMSAGVPLIQAIESVAMIVGNSYVEKEILDVKDDLRKGIELSELIGGIGVFPQMAISMIKIGEESGDLDNILDKTSDYYDDEVENSLQRLITLIEPVMIIVMAIIISVVAGAMLLPIFDLMKVV
jgi:type IV pilus assembly protein PilC